MKQRRNRSDWVLEPEARTTINQQIGGMLYDFIEHRTIPFSDGVSRHLLSCVREETRMSDRTLKRIFLGNSDSLSHYLRILFAIQGWTPASDYKSLWDDIGFLLFSFSDIQGEQFLTEQALLHRPKHKSA